MLQRDIETITKILVLLNDEGDRVSRTYLAKLLRRKVAILTENDLVHVNQFAPPDSTSTSKLTQEEHNLMLNDKKIAAIKSFRNRIGCSLHDAKVGVEKLDPRDKPVPF